MPKSNIEFRKSVRKVIDLIQRVKTRYHVGSYKKGPATQGFQEKKHCCNNESRKKFKASTKNISFLAITEF